MVRGGGRWEMVGSAPEGVLLPQGMGGVEGSRSRIKMLQLPWFLSPWGQSLFKMNRNSPTGNE